jgi:hypothetical protein
MEMQVQEQLKKDACIKSLHSKQEGLRTKVCALQDSLDAMKGRLHNEKSKRRKVMFDEESKRKRMQNEIEELNDWIFELDEERKVAEANEKEVREKYYNAVKDAQTRLHRWRQEREIRRDAENKMAEQDKHAKKQAKMYAHLLADFNEITTDHKRSMQKEWDDEEAARKHGGGRRWPIWVVQLICELLVTGTPPSAIPQIIQTFCETLLREKPKELPSVNFVRECRVIMEVIGETIVAIKLAHVAKWDQLWYDGTTRRQIPFGALIIGMLAGDNNMMDPVVVSSCIFMENETSETQAEGIVDKVRVMMWFGHWLAGG